MPRARLAGVDTHWIAQGDGPETLLIHCALGRAAGWHPLMAALPGRSHVAFDLPGHGRSSAWDPAQEPLSQAVAVAGALIGSGPEPVDVIGHSFGAVIALRLALARPDCVRALVLIEPVLFAAADPAARAAYAAQTAPQDAAFAAGDWDTGARLFFELWGNGARWTDLRPAERDDFRARIPLIPRTHPVLVADAAGIVRDLGGLHCPVLLIAGNSSPPVVDAIQTGLLARLPVAQRAMIAGAGHMVPLSHPGAVAARIAPFLHTDVAARTA